MCILTHTHGRRFVEQEDAVGEAKEAGSGVGTAFHG